MRGTKGVIEKLRSVPLTVKVSVSYTICSILQRCLSFITLPLFTRLLTKEQYGQYTLYQSWMSILMIFTTLNLAYGSFSTAMVKFEDRRDEYISSIEGICLFLSGIFLLLYLPFRNLWNRLFELPAFLMVLMVTEILMSMAIQLWSGKKRFEFKYKSVIGVTLGMAVCAPIAAFLLVIVCEEKGYARILGYALTNIVVGGAVFILNIRRGKSIFTKEFWKYAFQFNIPLLTYYLSQVIFNQSDRIMISHITGMSDAAMYGVAYSLATILIFVLNAINNSYVPWLYSKMKEGDTKENGAVSCAIAFLMSLLLLGVIWFAPEIIQIMAGDDYLQAVGVVAPVTISLLLLCYVQFFINVEFYYEEKKLLVISSVGAALLNIVLNVLLIPKFTFVAAGYTTLFSYIIFAVCNYFAMRATLIKHNKPNDAYNIKGLLAIFFLFVMISYLGVVLYGNFLLRIIITIAAALIILWQRKLLLQTVLKIRERK